MDQSRNHFDEFRQGCNQAAGRLGGLLNQVEETLKREFEAIRPKAEKAARSARAGCREAAPHFRRAAGNLRDGWRAFWEAEKSSSDSTDSERR
ncbi:MAG TPA: hypothetical protein VMN76_02710 [Acidobacteriota bacterium]|nr:hypothetical protein [Acidobacteriota bacterium]